MVLIEPAPTLVRNEPVALILPGPRLIAGRDDKPMIRNPEPATLLLVGGGLAMLLAFGGRERRRRVPGFRRIKPQPDICGESLRYTRLRRCRYEIGH